jgi:hypothetical protein
MRKFERCVTMNWFQTVPVAGFGISGIEPSCHTDGESINYMYLP